MQLNNKTILFWFVLIVLGVVSIVSFVSLVLTWVPLLTPPADPFSTITSLIFSLSGIYFTYKSKEIDKLPLVKDGRAILRCKLKVYDIINSWLTMNFDYGPGILSPQALERQESLLMEQLMELEDTCGSYYPDFISLLAAIRERTAIPFPLLTLKDTTDWYYRTLDEVRKRLGRELKSVLKRDGFDKFFATHPSRWTLIRYRLKGWWRDRRTAKAPQE